MKKRKLDENGFTLLEMLTVLALIAILAAVCAPSMAGFIDQAKGKSYIPEARVVYLALGQMFMDDNLEINMAQWDQQGDEWMDYMFSILDEVNDDDGIKNSRLETYLDNTYTEGARITEFAINGLHVSGMVYEVDGYKIEFHEGEAAQITKAKRK